MDKTTLVVINLLLAALNGGFAIAICPSPVAYINTFAAGFSVAIAFAIWYD